MSLTEASRSYVKQQRQRRKEALRQRAIRQELESALRACDSFFDLSGGAHWSNENWPKSQRAIDECCAVGVVPTQAKLKDWLGNWRKTNLSVCRRWVVRCWLPARQLVVEQGLATAVRERVPGNPLHDEMRTRFVQLLDAGEEEIGRVARRIAREVAEIREELREQRYEVQGYFPWLLRELSRPAPTTDGPATLEDARDWLITKARLQKVLRIGNPAWLKDSWRSRRPEPARPAPARGGHHSRFRLGDLHDFFREASEGKVGELRLTVELRMHLEHPSALMPWKMPERKPRAKAAATAKKRSKAQ